MADRQVSAGPHCSSVSQVEAQRGGHARADLAEGKAARQMGGHRGEDIASVKGGAEPLAKEGRA